MEGIMNEKGIDLIDNALKTVATELLDNQQLIVLLKSTVFLKLTDYPFIERKILNNESLSATESSDIADSIYFLLTEKCAAISFNEGINGGVELAEPTYFVKVPHQNGGTEVVKAKNPNLEKAWEELPAVGVVPHEQFLHYMG